METAFVELSLLVAIATLLAGIARLLKQPLIIAYILAGVLASPALLGVLESSQTVADFAQIGVALLLFIVGLQLSPKAIKNLAGVSLIVGLGQVLITGALGYLIATLLGFGLTASLYIAIAVTISSTIIIMKLLSDKGDLTSLYGRLSVGLLLVQDIIIVFVLLFISSSAQGLPFSELVIGTLIKALLLFIPLALFSIYVLPRIVRFASKSNEFLFIFSIGWAFFVAALFHYFNFSVEIGALLAGVTLSVSPFKQEISTRIRPVRDFFVILFFIWLGSQIIITDLSGIIWPVIIISLFILLIEPIIITILLGWLGFKRRTAFMTSIAMAQISEFSLILVALGIKNGQISQEVFSIVALSGLITIAISSYLIMFNSRIYPYFDRFLKIFEREDIKREDDEKKKDSAEIVLFGYNRIGHSFGEEFKRAGYDFLVVDHDPEAIEDAEKHRINYRYGDAYDPQLLEELNFSQTQMVISTIPDFEVNRFLIDQIKEKDPQALFIVVAHQISQARELYEKGADYVLLPHFLGGDYGAWVVKRYGFEKDRYQREKEKHLEELEKRADKGHEHPSVDGKEY